MAYKLYKAAPYCKDCFDVILSKTEICLATGKKHVAEKYIPTNLELHGLEV